MKHIIGLTLLFASAHPLIAETAQVAEDTPCKMCSAWTQYEKARKNNTRPSLADYSYVGYECGDKPLPQIKGPVFKVTDYGANPDDGKSDKAAIIKAIAAAASKGGGVIL